MYNRLQYISQGQTAEEQLAGIARVLDQGAKWVQLRFKNVTPSSFLKLGEQVKKQCEAYRATFIVNDAVAAAVTLNADGVHLGLQDTSIAAARQLLGPHKIIGGTANTLEQVLQRAAEECQYIGLGPYAFTKTKTNLSPILGLEGYQAIMKELRERAIEIPVYAIGGIQTVDIAALRATGVYGIAVSGLLTQTPAKVSSLLLELNHQ